MSSKPQQMTQHNWTADKNKKIHDDLKNLSVSKHYQPEKKKLLMRKSEVDEFNSKIERQPLIRYTTLIIDFSRGVLKMDMD